MKVLMISPFLPYPPDKGTSIRNWNLIRRLSGRCEFSLLSLINTPEQRSFVPHLKKYCPAVETVLLQRQSKLKHLPGVLRHMLSGQPSMNKFLRVGEMVAKIQEYTRQNEFDVIQIEGSPLAPYAGCIHTESRAKTVLTFIDIESIKLRRRLFTEASTGAKLRTLIDWLLMMRWEARYAERFDVCITMSKLDAQRLKERNPRLNAWAVPNGVDTDSYCLLPNNGDSPWILLVGYLYHSPWEDAVLYFHKDVFPLIQREFSAAKMLIVGEPTPRVKQLESKDVRVVGYVQDVRPYYQTSALSVVPLRAAGGTRLKILESMALGRPVVSTSIGCEGLDVVSGEHLLVANDPKGIAEQTIRILKERKLRQGLVQNSRAFVEAKYDWDGIAKGLLSIYEREINLGGHKA